ncbi:dihydropteroate synthase [Humitalea sp. 24SJ18S-53]|uniref:dihydropteroate synthase n=1 Tax=Humitalea sp. 24SJ18S-53 TaxID=3422307 RepID=UPI003D678DDA
MIDGSRWIEPLGLLDGPAAFAAVGAGRALPLAGGPMAFCLARLIQLGVTRAIVPAVDVPDDWSALLDTLTEAPPPFAGLAVQPGRPLVMGIVNVTPDSFSDGGRHASHDAAIAAGHAMLAAGADILDIGGESTRPGAAPVTPAEECARVLPVIRALATAAPLSIDTRNASTMALALEAGAEIVNDVTGLRHDPLATRTVSEARAPVVLMHSSTADPRTMQAQARYDDPALEVAGFLAARIAAAGAAGIPRARICVDPGIGFGKTAAHNLAILDRLPLFLGLGCAILVGASRKRFIGTLSGQDDAARRGPGSIGAALAAAARGAAIIRVHDVAETIQALAVWRAIQAGDMPALDDPRRPDVSPR